MTSRIWGAHAPPRAGDDALVIANFFSLERAIWHVCTKTGFGEGAETSTRGACAPQKLRAASSYLTK
jgi:hypothetical protein